MENVSKTVYTSLFGIIYYKSVRYPWLKIGWEKTCCLQKDEFQKSLKNAVILKLKEHICVFLNPKNP